MKMIALHGFLGRPSDWSPSLVEPFDLFDHPILPFWDWAEMFNKKFSQKTGPQTLVGYSLGGRLALHALIQNPSLWDAAIILSAHPGLVDEKEKKVRHESDCRWAARFLVDSWEVLMEDWNAQAVFQGESLFLKRIEEDFCRTSLAQALDVWSLGRQENLRASLHSLNVPIVWGVGEFDQKFVSIAETLSFSHPDSEVRIIENAGHRLIFSSSNCFS